MVFLQKNKLPDTHLDICDLQTGAVWDCLLFTPTPDSRRAWMSLRGEYPFKPVSVCDSAVPYVWCPTVPHTATSCPTLWFSERISWFALLHLCISLKVMTAHGQLWCFWASFCSARASKILTYLEGLLCGLVKTLWSSRATGGNIIAA